MMGSPIRRCGTAGVNVCFVFLIYVTILKGAKPLLGARPRGCSLANRQITDRRDKHNRAITREISNKLIFRTHFCVTRPNSLRSFPKIARYRLRWRILPNAFTRSMYSTLRSLATIGHKLTVAAHFAAESRRRRQRS